ncbi:TonB-dependent receptor [candidate division KSB1 bacterium]|nr:TonB-dependent receptor [candidate division KSB1 bacterium]
MKYFLFIFLIFDLARAQVGTIEGYVFDSEIRSPLSAVNVFIPNTSFGAATDESGYFIIKNVTTGSYNVVASIIGYQKFTKTEINVNSGRSTRIQFDLAPTVIKLDNEITVTSGYFDRDATQPVSSKQLSLREIRMSPGSAEDIFRIIQTMPGVATAGSRNASLIVRGGMPDENKTLLDNIEIYNPLHFSRQGESMGIISIIDPALLKNVEFLTGGFPARYGDKMSSVFEMTLKEGSRSGFNKDINLNLSGLSAYLDGPVTEKSSLVLSARRGYFDLLTSMMNKPVLPRYWDAVGKMTYYPIKNHKISIVGFYYQDDVEKTGVFTDAQHEMSWKFKHVKRNDQGSALGLNWQYLFSNKGYLLTTFSWTRNSWTSTAGNDLDPALKGEDITEDKSEIKSKLTYQVTKNMTLESGVYLKYLNSNYYTWMTADTTRTGYILPRFTVNYYPPKTFKSGGYLLSTLRMLSRLSLNTGIRYDYYDLCSEGKWSPRMGLSYQLDHQTTFNIAAGYFYQTPAPYQMAQHPDNSGLRSSYSLHYIAGVEHLILEDTKLSVEVFFKDINNAFVFSDTTNRIHNHGSGYAKGLEIYLQKKLSHRISSSLAYTYSLARRRENDSLPLTSFEFDQPHNLTALASYKLTRNWQIGIKFLYATGLPYTPVVGTRNQGDKWYIVEGEKYSARYPDFHKLDIRIDRNFHFTNWSFKIYLDVWNVYNRDNILLYTFDPQENGVIKTTTATDFPLLPILGMSAQF